MPASQRRVARRQATTEPVSVSAQAETEAVEQLTHPEEMLARVRFQIGPASVEGRARTTPAGLIGVALVLFSTATLVWAARRRQ